MSGGACVNDMAKGKMFHTTVLPANPVFRLRSNYTGRSSPTLPGSGLEIDVTGAPGVMLNVMSFHDETASAGAQVANVSASGGFVGARVATSDAVLVVLLRNDPNGTSGSSTSFTSSGATKSAVMVAGLSPGRYQVRLAGQVLYGDLLVDGNGMLSFEVPAGSALVDIARTP
jgi:hypothetical protein